MPALAAAAAASLAVAAVAAVAAMLALAAASSVRTSASCGTTARRERHEVRGRNGDVDPTHSQPRCRADTCIFKPILRGPPANYFPGLQNSSLGGQKMIM
eukprot:343122-Chlamydomonas_euryale.AAC.2